MPKTPVVLAQAIRIWLGCDHDPKMDAVLLEHLEHQGVITATERIQSFIEPQCREHDLVHVYMADGDVVQITRHARVDYFPMAV